MEFCYSSDDDNDNDNNEQVETNKQVKMDAERIETKSEPRNKLGELLDDIDHWSGDIRAESWTYSGADVPKEPQDSPTLIKILRERLAYDGSKGSLEYLMCWVCSNVDQISDEQGETGIRRLLVSVFYILYPVWITPNAILGQLREALGDRRVEFDAICRTCQPQELGPAEALSWRISAMLDKYRTIAGPPGMCQEDSVEISKSRR